MLFLAGLAVSPDVDYIALWVFHYVVEPRYTHSLGYCLGVGTLAWLLKRTLLRRWLDVVPSFVLFLAPLSHLVLDLFVGVYPMPLFWPLSLKWVVLPFGVLPSAGRLDPTNIYLWRTSVGIWMTIGRTASVSWLPLRL